MRREGSLAAPLIFGLKAEKGRVPVDEITQSVVVKLLAHKVDSDQYKIKDQEHLIASYEARIDSYHEELADLRERNESLLGRVELLERENSRLRFDNQTFVAEYNRRNEQAERAERLKKDPIDLLPTMEMDAAKAIINRIVDFLGRNEKIPAIKWLREELYEAGNGRFGLREAKDVVDVVAARLEAGTLEEAK